MRVRTEVPTRRTVRGRGFTFLEIIMVVALIGLIAGIGIPFAIRTVYQSRIQGVNFEHQALFKLARLEAIRSGRPTLIEVDIPRRTLRSFVDTDQNGLVNPAVDRQVGHSLLPANLDFGGPPSEPPIDSDATIGFTSTGATEVFRFNIDGSVPATGALRYGDVERMNFFEIRVGPSRAVGKVTVKKWHIDLGAWLAENELDDATTNFNPWVWYG